MQDLLWFFNDGNPAGSPNWDGAFAMNQLVYLNDQMDLAESVRLDDSLMAADACSLHRESTVRIEPLEDEETEEEDEDPSKKGEDPSKQDEDPSKEK